MSPTVNCSLQECLGTEMGNSRPVGLGPKMQIWLGGDRSSAPEFPAVCAAFQLKGSRDQSSEIMRRCARNKTSSIRELTRRGESSTYSTPPPPDHMLVCHWCGIQSEYQYLLFGMSDLLRNPWRLTRANI